jgi:cytochrome d ubiquinol oxidase subunit II
MPTMELPIDYATLRVIWWALMGVLFIAFALTDGFDMGVGALLPFVAKTDEERRMVINTVGSTWEGNQVWFITGGASIFAAWPLVYGVAFSGFYLAMFLVLAAMILRPVGFKYRSKRPEPRWRSFWDWALFTGGFVPVLVFGVAVGNLLSGAHFKFDSDLRVTFQAGFWSLFTPFTLLCGLLSVSMLVLHGAAWLTVKGEAGPVTERARVFGEIAGLASIVLFAAGGFFVAFSGMGFRLEGLTDAAGPSNPLRTGVVAASGAWLDNYVRHGWMIVFPVLGFVGTGLALLGLRLDKAWMSFTGSSAATLGIVATVGLSMFPFILPSVSDPGSSLTVWNSSSSHLTLFIMLFVTAIFLPLILLYTSWVYKVLWGRSSTAALATNPDLY